MATEHTKKIKILSKGIIPSKGFIYGPVLTPYYETIENIFCMIARGTKVVEVLADKSEVELTTSNYNAINSVVVEEKKAATQQPTEEPTVQTPEIEKPEIQKTEEKKPQDDNYKKHHNFNNRNNNRNPSKTSVVPKDNDNVDEVLEEK